MNTKDMTNELGEWIEETLRLNDALRKENEELRKDKGRLEIRDF